MQLNRDRVQDLLVRSAPLKAALLGVDYIQDRGGVLWVETTTGIDRLKKDRFVAFSTANSASTGAEDLGLVKTHLESCLRTGPPMRLFMFGKTG
jgi:hypothetical protein